LPLRNNFCQKRSGWRKGKTPTIAFGEIIDFGGLNSRIGVVGV
jgi:hypothetical protein